LDQINYVEVARSQPFGDEFFAMESLLLLAAGDEMRDDKENEGVRQWMNSANIVRFEGSTV